MSRPVRRAVRFLSELCITAGLVILLFVVYVVHWTGIKAADAADAELDRLRDRWALGRIEAPAVPPGTPAPVPAPSGAPGTTGPASPPATPGPRLTRTPAARTAPAAPTPPRTPRYRPGEPFAVMYVPRFGRDWDWPVLAGTGVDTLKRGLGHYSGTAAPGRTGNFAVAGHRRTYGDPFKDVPRLRPGDAVVLTDGTTWYTYRVARGPYRTVPTDIGVIDPVPAKSPFSRPGRYLTLTTCEPEWGSSHRLIVWARLAETRPVTAGEPAALRD
ncbi:class E sortase [Streptomyces yaizuensis]|uniref:Class E sortase n=1 Tax=Streptomyces yaizuensis TaxID=2989713 RepID=A0ABQ5P254_9ACTN|nr:class E sortase [Streptomyces sp. YSPA8]GLF96688.1 class E sortase [Streptomyces sp. YSPA8]